MGDVIRVQIPNFVKPWATITSHPFIVLTLFIRWQKYHTFTSV